CDPRTAAPLIAAERAVAQRIGHPKAMTIPPHFVAPHFAASAPTNPLQPQWMAQGSVRPQRPRVAQGPIVSARPPVSSVDANPAFGVFIQYVSAQQIR
ncbi:MAG: hypothetical protein K1Y02_25860, partial [Candidatus Hydrogenedentes bacterium]|nr:hypothetical protein [Candidatus Hydrogenedentota bacterium]